MLGFFKKREWQLKVLPELRGTASSLAVRLTNVPCLHDAATGERKYVFPDFGHDFLYALHDAIGGARHAHVRLAAGSSIAVSVRLAQQPVIGVEMSGKPNDSVRIFESDIADALISAFGSADLRP